MTIFARMMLGSVAAALVLASPANAQAGRVGNDSYHIYFTGLDLTKPADRAEALHRVDRAAAKLCEPQLRARDCAEQTTADTVAKMRTRWLRLALSERDAVRLAAR